jgi:hypothetical protein
MFQQIFPLRFIVKASDHDYVQFRNVFNLYVLQVVKVWNNFFCLTSLYICCTLHIKFVQVMKLQNVILLSFVMKWHEVGNILCVCA